MFLAPKTSAHPASRSDAAPDGKSPSECGAASSVTTHRNCPDRARGRSVGASCSRDARAPGTKAPGYGMGDGMGVGQTGTWSVVTSDPPAGTYSFVPTPPSMARGARATAESRDRRCVGGETDEATVPGEEPARTTRPPPPPPPAPSTPPNDDWCVRFEPTVAAGRARRRARERESRRREPDSTRAFCVVSATVADRASDLGCPDSSSEMARTHSTASGVMKVTEVRG